MRRIVAACVFLTCVSWSAAAQTAPQNLAGRGAQGANGVVSAAKPRSSQIGIDVLKMGGNAVDAAVAVGFAQGVLEPNANGLGGGGFMVIKLAGMAEAVVIDFRETAPAAATPGMFRHDAEGKPLPLFGPDGKPRFSGPATQVGGMACAVPGEVAGLLYALERYGSGKLTRRQLMQPAIEWAMKVPVTPELAGAIMDYYAKIEQSPAAAAIYLNEGLPYEAGDTIRNPDLQATLEAIAEDGAGAFYEGEIARTIAAEVQAQGGIMTAEDLRSYTVAVRMPVTGTYRGYTIVSTPPASSGGTHVIEILNILENWDIGALGHNTAGSLHLLGEAMKLAYADRTRYMADTGFVTVPLSGLTSKAYAKELAARVSSSEVLPLPVEAGDPFRYESGSTTSYSVMDKAGNMVACTKTINYFFGSCVVVPGTGIIMNNEMNDFVPSPGSANSVEPGKRPLSSMSPTLVMDPQGRPFITIGAAGSTRIISAVAQIISNVVDHRMPLQQAISAPRVYRTESTGYSVEGRIPSAALDGLLKLGHTVVSRQEDYAAFQGVAQGCLYDHAAGVIYGGADPRRDGQAAAY